MFSHVGFFLVFVIFFWLYHEDYQPSQPTLEQKDIFGIKPYSRGAFVLFFFFFFKYHILFSISWIIC